MSEYESLQLILELETRAGEQGDYFVTALFAFIVVIYLFGQKMTRSMVLIVSAIYSAYSFLNIVAIWAALERIVEVQEKWPVGLADGQTPEAATYFVPVFWLSVWATSMLFMVLVLKQKIEVPNA